MQCLVVADEKVGVVENVEGFGAELEAKPLGNLEIPEQRCIKIPVGGTNERVPADVSNAAQAGCGEEIAGKIEPVGPLVVRGMDIIGERIGPVIALAIEVVIPA